ncbi:hypothetical protein [Flavobacterium magnesitis]
MKVKLLFLVILSFALLICCQREEEIIIGGANDPAPNALVANSPLTQLIARMTQVPTFLDNVLDGTSCFAVQLPVTVIVNSQTIVVNTSSDYQTVQDKKDVSTTDDDIVNFVYPIAIVFKNGTVKNINTSLEFQNAKNNCTPESNLAEISCVRIVYPITLNLYDVNNQLASTLVLRNSSQFFSFVTNLKKTDLTEITYPIMGVNALGNSISIADNNALENFIESAIPQCNSGSTASFLEILKSGSWRVGYFYDDDDDETDEYAGYSFVFNANNTTSVIKTNQNSTGSWSYTTIASGDFIDFSFMDDDLSELEEDWKVIEFSNNSIRFKENTDDDDPSYLTLSKN